MLKWVGQSIVYSGEVERGGGKWAWSRNKLGRSWKEDDDCFGGRLGWLYRLDWGGGGRQDPRVGFVGA